MVGVQYITNDQVGRYARCDIERPEETGIIAFLEEQYILPETRKVIKLERWQKDWILTPVFYDLHEGKRKYNILLMGLPKKNGKSAFGAGIALYTLFAGEPYGEIIIAANAKDQASMIIYTKVRRAVSLNYNLKRSTLILKQVLEGKTTGTTIRCVAHQYETAAGLNPNLTVFDELWAFGDRRFFDELTLVPTRPDPLIVIVTYAGYEQKGLLWDLYSDGMAGPPVVDTGDPEVIVRRGKKDPGMFMFWSYKNLASWIMPSYLEGQRRRLPPEVFARLHENRWVTLGSQFITHDDIEAMHNVPWFMQTTPRTDRHLNYIVASDIGLSHDRTARVVGHYNPDDRNIYIDNIRVWQGTMEEHVNLEEVEQDLVECANTFKARTLVIDPWQMEYTIQRLKGAYTVVPFNASTDTQLLSQVFVNMLRSHRLVCYHDPMFEEELSSAIIKQTMKGWRIDHKGNRKNDIIIAVGMMMLEALKAQYGIVAMPTDDDFLTPPAAFKGIRAQEF